MITFTSKGSFSKTTARLQKMSSENKYESLDKYGAMGRDALANATPKDSSKASQSWSFTVERTGSGCTISWFNSDNENGFPVAIALQYGYGTGTGGYVQGRDYINPAIKPIFDQIEEAVRKEVMRP